MADITLGRDASWSSPRAQVFEWVLAHREIVALAALMLIAALLRFWALDAKALHHDESLHAQFTYYLYHGTGYKHDPLMHGPFLFEAGALIFFLFGDTDYTVRILPALFGTLLVGMPFLLRRQLGMRTVLIAAVLLTFSPTLLYVSRFIRDDIYITVWTLAMVICIWRYIDEQKSLYLYALAAAMAFSFASMEITFIHVAIILIFIDLMLAVELSRGRGGRTDNGVDLASFILLAPVAWLIAAAWPLLGAKPLGRDKLPPIGDVMVVVGTMALPQFAAAIQVLPFIGDKGYNVPEERTLRTTTVLALFIASVYVGLLWRPKVWLITAACFYIPFVLMYTTFFTNIPGFWSGIWGSLDYWLGQHHVKRGNQPIYYYGLMTPLYEYLPLLLTIGGAAWMAVKGDALKRWLLFWVVGIFVGLSFAGEKMPWLEVHIALPLALTGAVALSLAIDALQIEGKLWQTAAAVGAMTLASVALLVDGTGAIRVVGYVMGAGLAGYAGASWLNGGAKAFGRAALTIAVVALFVLTARTGLIAAFKNDDTPVDMLVYTQTSPDVPKLRDRIDTVAKQSGLGLNLPIVVDSSDGYAWPWAWYLRDYKDVAYVTPTAQYQPPAGAILLIDRSDVGFIDTGGYTETPYKHRWWFNETYRDLTLSKVASVLTSRKDLKSLAHFFLYRRDPATKTGSSDAVAYFPDSLAAFDTNRTPARPAPEPVAQPDGRIVAGRGGSGPGELQQPAGMAVDAQGNIYVADSRNNRIEKYDATGHQLDSVGRGSATHPATLNEPWALAIDKDGFVYVADTWAHRLLKFSPQLDLVTSWGQPALRTDPGPLELFGPRSIAVAPDGTLWVTDTGNKRLIHYTNTGEPLGVVGREGNALGSFLEPVGLAYDTDGHLYVADTWNGRIQRFDGETAQSSFATGWTSRDVTAKPYLAVLSDGRILATDPAKGVLLLFAPDGRPLGFWHPEADSMPIGVVALPDGGFAFSDARRGELQIVPAEAVNSLFK